MKLQQSLTLTTAIAFTTLIPLSIAEARWGSWGGPGYGPSYGSPYGQGYNRYYGSPGRYQAPYRGAGRYGAPGGYGAPYGSMPYGARAPQAYPPKQEHGGKPAMAKEHGGTPAMPREHGGKPAAQRQAP